MSTQVVRPPGKCMIFPPTGLIPVEMKGAVLLLTTAEFMAGIRRGKWWRRRVAMEQREPHANLSE